MTTKTCIDCGKELASGNRATRCLACHNAFHGQLRAQGSESADRVLLATIDSKAKSVAEIAKDEGVTRAAVYHRIKRARERFPDVKPPRAKRVRRPKAKAKKTKKVTA